MSSSDNNEQEGTLDVSVSSTQDLKEHLQEVYWQATGEKLSKDEASLIIGVFREAVIRTLKTGTDVCVYEFGTWYIRKRDEREQYSHIVQDDVKVPAKVVAGFRASDKLNDELTDALGDLLLDE